MDYNLKESYGTLSETINELTKLGYTQDFNIQDDHIMCLQTNSVFSPVDFQIDKVYRFEGDADPDYQSILYAISSIKFDIKGILVNGYGIYTDVTTSELIVRLSKNQPHHGNEIK
jgi:hypothetical protein